MNEIEDEIYDILAGDTGAGSIQAYVNPTAAADTRVYHEEPPEQVAVNVTYPAYITMGFSTPGPIPTGEYVQPAQYPDEVVELNVWANSGLLRGQIAERIMILFWATSPGVAPGWDLDTNTEIVLTNFIIKRVVQEATVNMKEILEEGTRQITLWRKFMRLRFGPIYAKLMGE